MKKLSLYFLLFFLPFSGFAQNDGINPQTPPPSYQDYFNPDRDLSETSLPDSRFADEFIKMLFILGAIVFFLFLLLWFMKKATLSRAKESNAQSKIKVIDHRLLSVRASVFLLDIAGDSYIAVDSQHGVSIIKTSQPVSID